MRAAQCALLAIICFASAAQAAEDPNQLVRRVIENEIQAENRDHSHWLLQLQTYKPGGAKETDAVVETKDGDLKKPLLINGQPVSKAEADKRLQQSAHDADALQKSRKEENEDSAHSQELLNMLPDAFLFTIAARRGSLVQLKFSPNPKFKPSNHEAEVFHAMQGIVWLDTKQNRLQEISGHLMHEVKFGDGLLGHLDPGGTFDVKQAPVAPGYWELTVLNVHMHGKVLFFKTIAVQQQYSRSQFKQVPQDLTVEQGVTMLEKQPSASPLKTR
jgi:hypothetical protein